MQNNIYKRIVIDAGHCDKFCGAWYKNGVQKEEVDNLRMALKVEEYLKSFGHTVYLTRRDGGCLDSRNKNVDLDARPAYANKMQADYFISIHRNSFVNDTATGIENWIYSKADSRTTYIAQCILNEVIAVASIKNRGIKKGLTGFPLLNYAVNRISKMPSCLLELTYISNPKDNALYNANFNAYAKAIAVGICKGMGCNSTVVGKVAESKPVVPVVANKPIVKPVEKPKAESPTWKIEWYTFTDKTRADNLKVALKALGYKSDVLDLEVGRWMVRSAPYMDKALADRVLNGITMVTGAYGEVKRV